MMKKAQPTKAVIHDGNGTWFAPAGLDVVLLTEQEVEVLQAGSTHVLAQAYGGATLEDLLPLAVEDPSIEWAWAEPEEDLDI